MSLELEKFTSKMVSSISKTSNFRHCSNDFEGDGKQNRFFVKGFRCSLLKLETCLDRHGFFRFRRRPVVGVIRTILKEMESKIDTNFCKRISLFVIEN